ncbi:hypothetical protein HH310_35125 [Actinoplanes sp. TBRC 11911]|uniref:hypothetical protein n=1 Tax=Actinoplanes sp. TBRC 11911 TaxID=2729386 RepID=UPI00145D17F2|nr:hypothetical protein [Actinoplanes sp. TBRC 11911]NMO56397.1 hypothetical protein [Actinoplanes sp. TBRC 11911]
MPREIGSEFHWDPSYLTAATDESPLPARHKLFATGCGALTALLRQLAPRGRLHLPSYFCMGVAEALSETVRISWYRHLPDAGGPRLETLRAGQGDVVLAQNLFGRETGEAWNAWMAAHPDVVVIEDHSHDPFSRWARTSQAAYAVASLRKTLPLPDGGLLWSPQERALPSPYGNPHGSDLKLVAMLLKSAWLAGSDVDKTAFRALQQRGEHVLLGSAAPAGALTTAILPLLDIERLQRTATANVRAMAEMLGMPPVKGTNPFRLQILRETRQERDDLLGHLAANGVYAPVHWRQDRTGLWSGDEQAAALSSRMLTLPVDHRCTPADLRRLAGVLGSPVRGEPARR